jgi:hypothetical protein
MPRVPPDTNATRAMSDPSLGVSWRPLNQFLIM